MIQDEKGNAPSVAAPKEGVKVYDDTESEEGALMYKPDITFDQQNYPKRPIRQGGFPDPSGHHRARESSVGGHKFALSKRKSVADSRLPDPFPTFLHSAQSNYHTRFPSLAEAPAEGTEEVPLRELHALKFSSLIPEDDGGSPDESSSYEDSENEKSSEEEIKAAGGGRRVQAKSLNALSPQHPQMSILKGVRSPTMDPSANPYVRNYASMDDSAIYALPRLGKSDAEALKVA